MKWLKSYSLPLLAILVLSLSSCYTKKQALRKFCTPSKEITKDSTWSEINTSSNSTTLTLDSVRFIPKTWITTTFNPCDSLGRVIENLNLELQSGIGKLTITSGAGGTLRVDCNCDSVTSRLRREVHSRDSLLSVEHSRNKHVVEIPPVEIRKVIPWWAKALMALGGILSIPTLFRIAKLIILKR